MANALHRAFGMLGRWLLPQSDRSRHDSTRQDHNFGALIANGFFFPIAGKILGTGLLLTWFVSDLTSSAFVAGLLIPVQYGISLLAQPWIGQAVAEKRYRVRYYVYQALVRAVVWFGLGLGAAGIDPQRRALLLIIFFAVVLTDAVAAGVGNIAFSETIARVLPRNLRGRARGFRGMAGAILGGIAGLLINRFVPADADIRVFGVLFALAGICYAVGGVVFGTIDEPTKVARAAPREGSAGMWVRIRDMLAHRGYRRFLAVQILLTPATQGLLFFTLLGRREFHLDLSALGLLIITDALAPLAGNFFWGRWADRLGNAWALAASAVAGLIAPGVALVLMLAGRGWSGRIVLTAFGVMVFALGVAYTGFDLASKNYVLELAPDEAQRPVYIGVNDTLLALPSTLFVGAGAAVDWFGYAPVFIGIAVCAAAALPLCRPVEPAR